MGIVTGVILGANQEMAILKESMVVGEYSMQNVLLNTEGSLMKSGKRGIKEN